MRFTIERLRTIILTAGVLLVVALGVFLARGTWRNPSRKIDKPHELGSGIEQEASGVTYRHTFGSHAVFEIHASKVTELKNDRALLHGVKIELYEADGSRVDRIEGDEFEYDRGAEIATAAGPVAITMMRPRPAPAAAKPGAVTARSPAQANPGDEIHVQTSGLVFYQKTGVATTDRRVEFSMTQGTGNALGATYDSERGYLVLGQNVTLTVRRNGEAIDVHAQHGEFERGDMICHLRGASAAYRSGEATAGQAQILFRDDGSAVRLDATNGFALATATGGHLTAPQGWLEFNDDNQPRRGHLEGGVTIDSTTRSDKADRQSHGAAPTAELDFTDDGNLRHAHLERGVELSSEERSEDTPGPLRVVRTWRSPVADMEFRMAGDNQVEPAWLHGEGGVAITGESQRGNETPLPSRLAADEMIVDFGPNSTMRDLKGNGHAAMEQTAGSGARQLSSGDHLEARFALPVSATADANAAKTPPSGSRTNTVGGAQIEAAALEGHVAIDQRPAPKPGESAAPMHATAGRADYEGNGEWIHLTESPRVDNSELQLTADKIDVSQTTGDAFAHGDVRATWFQVARDKANAQREPAGNPPTRPGAGQRSAGLGGQGPSHVISSEAHLQQSTGEATFRGNARLWQEANSVRAPVIVLNRLKQTLVASSSDSLDPVRVVLLSAPAENAEASRSPQRTAGSHRPAVIRMMGGLLKYSDAEHKAWMFAGKQGVVAAETPTAQSVSDQVELTLLAAGDHAGKEGGAAQVDELKASGHVAVTSQGRKGTGTQLVYAGETGEYVLTGTSSEPPRMTDPARGYVTGEALIFRSRDDSVSIEGGGSKTVTETRTPK